MRSEKPTFFSTLVFARKYAVASEVHDLLVQDASGRPREKIELINPPPPARGGRNLDTGRILVGRERPVRGEVSAGVAAASSPGAPIRDLVPNFTPGPAPGIRQSRDSRQFQPSANDREMMPTSPAGPLTSIYATIVVRGVSVNRRRPPRRPGFDRGGRSFRAAGGSSGRSLANASAIDRAGNDASALGRNESQDRLWRSFGPPAGRKSRWSGPSVRAGGLDVRAPSDEAGAAARRSTGRSSQGYEERPGPTIPDQNASVAPLPSSRPPLRYGSTSVVGGGSQRA